MLKAPAKSDGKTGTEILLEAMSKDKVHLARFVLDALDGEIVDSKTEGAQTPLISSILLPDHQTRCKFVELLLQKGAGVNCQDADGRTALSHACEKGYLDAVKVLVRNNADPEVVDSWGNTALMYAAVAGHSAVVEFLVRAFKRLGLQIDRQNKVGNSAIEVAKFLGHTECIFALSHNSKKSREADGGARGGNAQPRASVGSEFESNGGHIVDKVDHLHLCDHAQCLLVQNCIWQPRPPMKQGRLPSIDSIEESDREDGGSSSPPHALIFSGVPIPVPPPRTYSLSPISKHPKTGERSDDHLPPLTHSCDVIKPIVFSPRPSRNTHKPPSALGILLTPILAKRSENEVGTDKSKVPDFSVPRFHDNYYKKRSSLPTSSMFSPAPPERTLVPLRKSRTVRRREAEPLQFPAPSAASTATTFSVLSHKLLRRFTSPEFKKDAKDPEQPPVLISGRIPRSETFPQCVKHPQVDSKLSVDSISSVRCEFDFHFRKPNC